MRPPQWAEGIEASTIKKISMHRGPPVFYFAPPPDGGLGSARERSIAVNTLRITIYASHPIWPNDHVGNSLNPTSDRDATRLPRLEGS
jgi:hypothetical protein